MDRTKMGNTCSQMSRFHNFIGLMAVLLLIPTSAHGPLQQGRLTHAEAAGRKVALTIVNESEVEICYVYLSPADSGDWGDDWLGTNNTIPPGESHIIQLAASQYDVRAEDCDHNVLSEMRGTAISGDMKWAVKSTDASTDQGTSPDKDRELTPTRDVALSQFLCCGKSVGETNIWSIRYPVGWKVEYFGTPDTFTGAAFSDPQGSIRLTFLPSGMPEAGSSLDTGEVDGFLDAMVEIRRKEDRGFEEFLRQPVPGLADARIWGGTWPGRGAKMWETYVVLAAPLVYIAPEVPRTYLMILGVRAASPDWALGVQTYEAMLKSVQIRRLKDDSQPQADPLEMGKPAVEPGMVRFCPKECDWEWISAAEPGWACPIYGEESYPYEVDCVSPDAE